MTNDEITEGQIHEAQARHLHAFLKTAILFGALAAGTGVTVASLVRRHRVSAKAARDALGILEEEGLVGRAEPGAPDVVTDRGKSTHRGISPQSAD